MPNVVECFDNRNLLASGATFIFRDPVTGRRELTVVAQGDEYSYTARPSNESLVSCAVDCEESEEVMVTGM